MQREYHIDLVDFYRGTLSARRLGVLVRGLSVDSSLTRTLNGGRRPWGQIEHLLADLWVVLVTILNPKTRTKDHPARVEIEAKTFATAKRAKMQKLRIKFEKQKRAYGLGGVT